ncbi:MAG TPA: hypothetical protein DEH78_03300 [Solibacterales bacterium]|nr:hypothetical protein [Bryobacterales bacterium]
MSVFVYRLQTLLDRKQAVREDAERRLAERLRELEEERQRLAAREREAREASALAAAERMRLMAVEGGSVSGRELRQRAANLDLLLRLASEAKDAVFEQKIAVNDAEDRLEEARRALAEAVRDVEVLNKHRERAKSRFHREQERKEAVEMDEARTVLFHKRGAK